jgi:hypothetical protein
MARSAQMEIHTQKKTNAMPHIRSIDLLTPVHRSAVTAIAGDMGISVDRVHKLYCIVLERLTKEARIRDYLPILVTRKVRNLVQKKLQIQDSLGLTERGAQTVRRTSDKQGENRKWSSL